MSIFNSLGSNYSINFVLKSLFAVGSDSEKIELEKILSEHYHGQVTLTYKGREALELALRRSELPTGSTIGINGFTCFVVYQAVINAGYKPVYMDVAAGQIHYGIEELTKARDANTNLKAIIIQNTLGYPVDIKQLNDYCSKNNIMIIEDLAHSTGLAYADSSEAGTVGDFTMLSFSRDKPLDAVSGGALIDRRNSAPEGSQEYKLAPWHHRFNNRLYPLWAVKIRATYSIGLGKILHQILKNLKLLTSGSTDDKLNDIYQMSGSTAKLIVGRWRNLDQEIAHRREIANAYKNLLPTEIQIKSVNGEPTGLRFPIIVNNRDSLIEYLRKSHIYISDTWYDVPIGPKRNFSKANYPNGKYPNAEKLAAQIVNLPTHIHVNAEKAKIIADKVNQWLKLQQPQ